MLDVIYVGTFIYLHYCVAVISDMSSAYFMLFYKY